MATYIITGRVVRRGTKQGVAGVRVEAWDKDLIVDDLVGSAVTDADGSFRIVFDESYFKELFLDRKPDLYFKVYRGDALIADTKDAVMWNVKTGQTSVTIEVDAAPGVTTGSAEAVVTPHTLVITLDDEHRQKMQQCLDASGQVTFGLKELSTTKLTNIGTSFVIID